MLAEFGATHNCASSLSLVCCFFASVSTSCF